MIQLEVSFSQGFQFILLDEGNLLIVANNQIESLMNEVYCIDDAEQL